MRIKTTKSATNPRPEVSRVLGIDPTSCFYKCLMFEGAERVEGGAVLPQAGVQGGGAEGTRPCQQEQGAPAGHPHQDLQGSGGHGPQGPAVQPALGLAGGGGHPLMYGSRAHFKTKKII